MKWRKFCCRNLHNIQELVACGYSLFTLRKRKTETTEGNNQMMERHLAWQFHIKENLPGTIITIHGPCKVENPLLTLMNTSPLSWQSRQIIMLLSPWPLQHRTNKKAFQYDSNRPIADRSCFIMEKFEHIRGGGGGGMGPVRWSPSWTSLNMSGGCLCIVRSKLNKFELG